MGFSSIKIDLTYFYSLTNADKAFELKLLTGTVADVDNLIKNLKNAWTIKDGEDVKKKRSFFNFSFGCCWNSNG